MNRPNPKVLPRLGGELPLFSDRYGRRHAWAPNWLAFSHGRAALAWLIERQRPKSALICAYTCPSVPAFLRRSNVNSALFDVGAALDDIVIQVGQLPAPRLVLVPALFGSPPWHSTKLLAKALGRSAIVVIDAAQTAFGHRDLRPPDGGATLSCPRKTTAVADGAILALGRGVRRDSKINRLPIAQAAASSKYAARALWATGRPELEEQAVELNRISESAWPDNPHRMSDESRLLLEHIDQHWHRTTRRRNRFILAKAMAGRIPTWRFDSGTPFSLPAFVREPAALIAELKTERIFATALWPDAVHKPDLHLAAGYMVRHLVSLPIDQRHGQSDMVRIAKAVLRGAEPPPPAPPALRRMMQP